TPMMSTPNGRPQNDHSREVVKGRGVFDYVPVEVGLQLGVRKTYREGNDLRAIQNGREAQLSIDRRYFPGEEEPKQGDLVDFLGRPDLPPFQVVSTLRDGLSRLVLVLVHIGA